MSNNLAISKFEILKDIVSWLGSDSSMPGYRKNDLGALEEIDALKRDIESLRNDISDLEKEKKIHMKSMMVEQSEKNKKNNVDIVEKIISTISTPPSKGKKTHQRPLLGVNFDNIAKEAHLAVTTHLSAKERANSIFNKKI